MIVFISKMHTSVSLLYSGAVDWHKKFELFSFNTNYEIIGRTVGKTVSEITKSSTPP